MSNLTNSSWYSGDWKSKNNIKQPYNGLKIIAKPNYGIPTSRPTSQKLVSVDLEIVDYTYSTTGVSSFVIAYKTDIWYEIAIPQNEGVSPPGPNSDFTVIGINNVDLGVVKLEVSPKGIFLNIKFRYGVESRKREELGYIMKFDTTYTEGQSQDPVEVEE